MTDEPRLYRHRPTVVAAVQAPVRGELEAEKDFEERLRKVVRWIYDEDGEASMSRTHIAVEIQGYISTPTLVQPGEWIVRSDNGNWSIMDNVRFNANYARVQ